MIVICGRGALGGHLLPHRSWTGKLPRRPISIQLARLAKGPPELMRPLSYKILVSSSHPSGSFDGCASVLAVLDARIGRVVFAIAFAAEQMMHPTLRTATK